MEIVTQCMSFPIFHPGTQRERNSYRLHQVAAAGSLRQYLAGEEGEGGRGRGWHPRILHLVGLLVSTALLLLSLVIFTIFPRSVFKVSYQGWTGNVFISRGEGKPKIYEAGGAGQG